MQATQPVRIINPARAGFAAVVLAAILVVAATIATFVAPSIGAGPATDARNAAPLVLDPDARDGAGRRGGGMNVPQ